MADIANEVNETMAPAVAEANETLITLAASLYNRLDKLPLHTHLGVMKVLEAQTEHRFTTMKLEAADRQQKAQEAFEQERAAEHARLQAEKAESKPKLVV